MTKKNRSPEILYNRRIFSKFCYIFYNIFSLNFCPPIFETKMFDPPTFMTSRSTPLNGLNDSVSLRSRETSPSSFFQSLDWHHPIYAAMSEFSKRSIGSSTRLPTHRKYFQYLILIYNSPIRSTPILDCRPNPVSKNLGQ